jgi:hypothetical protein
MGSDKLAGTFHCRRSCLLKTGFLGHVPNVAENTKEKSRRCFTDVTLMKYEMLGYFVKFRSNVCQLHTLSNCQITQSTLLFPNFANFTFAKL